MKHIEILFENEEILIINKPSGVAVQGGSGILHPLDKILPEQLGFPIYLVHRLDIETSGLMIVAKSPFFASVWTKKIGSKHVKKEYTAICIGRPTNKTGMIADSVMQHGLEKNACTHYRFLEERQIDCGEEIVTLSKMRLTLETGRMHQIRIHLSKQNLPIAGDDKHGNFKINKILKKTCKIKHLLLCSSSLSFLERGETKTITISPPDYFPF
ncbi:MAG: RluA family pseudouridine synthase [Treponema sp.]|nr:RluA family pseudouridine synthase [Treponema sp.]